MSKKDKKYVRKSPDWASGPKEILQHVFEVLETNRKSRHRISMILIDSAVELTIKTYLTLPKRKTGISLPLKEYKKISDNFTLLLNALERLAPKEKLEGIDLGEIEYYHRLRNRLYHEGIGLTIDSERVEVYAGLANLLFKNLFDTEIHFEKTTSAILAGKFINAWSRIERSMYSLASLTFPKKAPIKGDFEPSTEAIHNFLHRDGTIDKKARDEIDEIRKIRNKIVHGQSDLEVIETENLLDRIYQLNLLLKGKIEEEEPKLTEDQRFILALIAESDEEGVDALFESYKKQFPDANLVDVKFILNKLDKDGLIRHTGNIRGNRLYRATEKGIEVAKKNSRIIEKYRKAIDEHIEMSKRAKEF